MAPSDRNAVDVVEAGAAVLVLARLGIEPAHRRRQAEGREGHPVAGGPRLGVGHHPTGHRDVGLVHLAHLICVVSQLCHDATAEVTAARDSDADLWCGRRRPPRQCGLSPVDTRDASGTTGGRATPQRREICSARSSDSRVCAVPFEHGAHRADDALTRPPRRPCRCSRRRICRPRRRAPRAPEGAGQCGQTQPEQQTTDEHQQRVGQRTEPRRVDVGQREPAHHHEHGEPAETEHRDEGEHELRRPKSLPPQGSPHLQGGAHDGLVERVGELGARRRRRVGDRLGPPVGQALGRLVPDPSGGQLDRGARSRGRRRQRRATEHGAHVAGRDGELLLDGVTGVEPEPLHRVGAQRADPAGERPARAAPGLVAVVTLDRGHDGGDAGGPREGVDQLGVHRCRAGSARSGPLPRATCAALAETSASRRCWAAFWAATAVASRIRRSSTPTPVVADVVMTWTTGDAVVRGEPREVLADLAGRVAGAGGRPG